MSARAGTHLAIHQAPDASVERSQVRVGTKVRPAGAGSPEPWGFCRCPACRAARTSGNGLVMVTTPKGRAWFDSMQTTTGSSEVEQSRKRPDAGSIPAQALERKNGRKTTRRTRGEGPPVAQQPQAHTPSAGGGSCQTRAPPAPAASPLPPHTRGAANGALQGPRLCPLVPRHRCNGTPIARGRIWPTEVK